MRWVAVACLCAIFPLEIGCRTTTETFPAGLRDVSAARARRTGLWEVRSRERSRGFVARYVEEASPARTYFVVQNAEGQDLGIVDALGRAWRYRPHTQEPDWLTTGTVLAGAEAILDLAGESVLVELEDDSPSPR